MGGGNSRQFLLPLPGERVMIAETCSVVKINYRYVNLCMLIIPTGHTVGLI